MYLSLQGNLGLGKAIEYFTSQRVPVSIPLNDTQPYDLIADFDGKLQRVQVKTSSLSRYHNSYVVNLRNCGGNRTGKTRVVHFDKTTCDYLFVYTANEKMYLIPSNVITSINAIAVGNKFTEYEVKPKLFNEFVKETRD